MTGNLKIEFRVATLAQGSGVKKMFRTELTESRVEKVGFDISGKLVVKKLRPQLALAKALTSF